MKKYIILLLALCSMSACDYEAVNTNPYGVSDGELGPLKYGARFMNMQQRVIPIGSPSLTTGPGNDLQNTDLISSGNYIGYFGNNNNFLINLELYFYIKSYIAHARLHEVVHIHIVITGCRSRQFRVKRCFAIDHPQVASYKPEGYIGYIVQPFLGKCIAKTEFLKTDIGGTV